MRKSAKIGLYAAVLAGMIGGTAAWATTDKAVAVSIDGQARTIHTRAATVGGALHDADIAVDAHDVVAPDPATRIHDGSQVVLRKGRLLHLDVDGRQVDVWTTSTTVQQALTELGYGSGKAVSVSRSTRLALTPTQITLLTPKNVTIVADHRTVHVITTKSTVGEVVADAGLTLGRLDRISPAVASKPTAGERVTIKRVTYKIKTKKLRIPFRTKKFEDSSHYVGTTIVVKAGQTGARKISTRFVYIDGKLASKKVVDRVIVKHPVARREKVGTKKRPAPPSNGAGSGGGSNGGGGSGPVPSGSAQSIARDMVSARGWDGGQFQCLVDLWNRESGWNTHAANPSGAYGIPQALPGSKMASAGPDWQNNAATQISWGLGYISARYGNPCGAWAHSQANNWY